MKGGYGLLIFFNNENMCVLNTFSLINDSVEFQPIKMQSLYQ